MDKDNLVVIVIGSGGQSWAKDRQGVLRLQTPVESTESESFARYGNHYDRQ